MSRADGRLDALPDRVYGALANSDGMTIREVCVAVRGKVKHSDTQYFARVLKNLSTRGLVEVNDGVWTAIPTDDFKRDYYEACYINTDSVLDCIRRLGNPTASEIDADLGIFTARGCYPVLRVLLDKGKVVRELVPNEGKKDTWRWSISTE